MTAFRIDALSHVSPNHSARKNPTPSAIVLHTGEGTRQSDLAWLKKMQDERSVSCHYYVCRDGTIFQLVPDWREAWHAGIGEYLGFTGWGDFSLGIETEHKQGQDWPQVQRDALAWLCEFLIGKYKIRRSMVVAHRWIAPKRKIDPTDWPDPELVAWIEHLYANDWEDRWGDKIHYFSESGIAKAWRDAWRLGTELGQAQTDEFNISGGGVCRAFTAGYITWHERTGTVVRRWV